MFLHELGLVQGLYNVHCDIQRCENSSFLSESKHIDAWYHLVRYVLKEKQIYIEKVDENGSDMIV